jgi:methionyl-tRNA synthetase
MTPQQTIETLKLMQAEVEWEYTMDYAVAIDEAIKALEKQIPMKPILKSGITPLFVDYADGHGEMKIQKWQDWVCPKCGWFVGQRFNAHRNGSTPHPHDQRKSDYCNECGQRISWEGNNEAT